MKCLCFRRGRKLSFYKQVNHCCPDYGGCKRLSLLLARFAEAGSRRPDSVEIGATVVGMEILGPGPKIKKRLEIKQLSSWLLARFPILNWKRWSIFFEELMAKKVSLLPVKLPINWVSQDLYCECPAQIRKRRIESRSWA